MENNQQNNEVKKVYTDGEVGAILESLRGDIKGVAEGHQILTRNIEEINTKLEKLDVIEGKLDVMNIKLGGKAETKTVEKHEERIIKLEKAAATA